MAWPGSFSESYCVSVIDWAAAHIVHAAINVMYVRCRQHRMVGDTLRVPTVQV